MGPLVILVVLLGLDRLLVRGGRIATTGAGRRWREVRPAAIAYLRSAPVSGVYLFILLITTWVLQTSSSQIANQLLLERSTNLNHLAHDPLRVLVASAFWLETTWQLLAWAPLVLVIVAPLERRLGSGKTIGVLAAGHIGATLLTAAGLWLALRADAVEHSVTNAKDVGPSYAFFAAAGCLAFLLDRWLRRWAVTALVGYGVVMVVVSTTFTDFGHLLSIAIGLACGPFVRPGRAHRARRGWARFGSTG